ncbi:MAG: MFS transporter [Clostridium sp.]
MTKQEKSWILQDFANSAYSIIITTALLPVFFKDFAASTLPGATSTAYWGYANSFSTLLIAFISPLIGILADIKGRKKKMFTYFTFIAIISTATLSLVGEGNWLLCLIIYIITVLGYSGSCLLYDSFLTDVTTDDRMDMISSNGFAYGYIGGTIPFVISVLLILFAPKLNISVITVTKFSFIMTSIWWIIFTIPLLRNVNQVYYIEENKEKEYIKESFKKLVNTTRKIRANKNLTLFLIAFFFYIDGVHTVISMATVFASDIGIDMSGLMIILIILQIVAVPFSILYGKLAKKYSSKLMIMIGIFTYCMVAIYALFITNLTEFLILALLVGSAQGGVQALSRSMFGKLIPKENSGEYFGIYNIFGRISSALGPLLVGIVAQITGETRYGVLSLIVLFILGALVFIKVEEPKLNVN